MNISFFDFNETSETESCSPKIYDFLSYGLNFILLIATVYSEVAGLSKCKSNGILDGIIKNINKKLETEELKISESGKIRRNSEYADV